MEASHPTRFSQSGSCHVDRDQHADRGHNAVIFQVRQGLDKDSDSDAEGTQQHLDSLFSTRGVL